MALGGSGSWKDFLTDNFLEDPLFEQIGEHFSQEVLPEDKSLPTIPATVDPLLLHSPFLIFQGADASNPFLEGPASFDPENIATALPATVEAASSSEKSTLFCEESSFHSISPSTLSEYGQESEKSSDEEEAVKKKLKKTETALKEAKNITDKDERRLLCNQHSASISRCKRRIKEIKAEKTIQKLKTDLLALKAENARLKKENNALKSAAQSESSLPKTEGSFEFNFVSEDTQLHLQFSPHRKNVEPRRSLRGRIKEEPSVNTPVKEVAAERVVRPIRERRRGS